MMIRYESSPTFDPLLLIILQALLRRQGVILFTLRVKKLKII